MSAPSLLILCGRAPRHLYVANRLCRSGNPVGIVQESGTQWTTRKVRRALAPSALLRRASRALRDRKRYAGGGEARFFFGEAEPKLDRPELVTSVPHVNDPSVVALARRSAPDVICVFGTSLIRGDLLELGRHGLVNLHGGLSPHYRGADCTFWALYNGEPSEIGCTLHFIDAGIDTGNLIAHVCPEIHEGDDELTLFWRAVRESAEVYGEVVTRLHRGESLGQIQSGRGALYQVKDRTWQRERELEQKMRSGLLRGVDLPRRVRWFTPGKESRGRAAVSE